MRRLHRLSLALASACSLTLLAACGGAEHEAGGEVDRAAADGGLPGPAVGDSAVKDAAADTLAAIRGRQDMADSLGLTVKQGLDSAAAAGARATANDTARTIPGVPRMRARDTTGARP